MGGLFISALVFSTMVPLSSSTAKILLQVRPATGGRVNVSFKSW